MTESNTHKVVRGISSQTIVTLVLGVVEVVSFAIMSRILTKEDFGYYAAIAAITAIFATFSETGIGSAIIQRKQLDSRYINNAFSLCLLFGLFVAVALFFLSGILAGSLIDNSMVVPLKLMSVTILLHCVTSVNLSLMYRKLQFLRVGLINLIALVVTTIAAVILALQGYGYYAIIAKAILSSVIVFILSFILCRTSYHFNLEKSVVKDIFRFSGWLMASNLFRNLAHQVDRLLMPRLLSVEALGAYNRPKEFIEQISSKLNGIFDSALFPVLSGIQDDIPRLQSAFRRSMYYMNIFSMFVSLAFIFNSELLIRIFFGNEWLYLKWMTMVLASTLIFNINGRLADCYLRSLGLTKVQFYFRMFETAVNTLSICIAYRWGVLGVAISFAVANALTKVIKIVYIASKVNIGWKDCLAIMLSSWHFAIVLLPISITTLFLPSSWSGNIITICVFLLTAVVIFLLTPRLVGGKYAQELHPQAISFIKNKLHL